MDAYPPGQTATEENYAVGLIESWEDLVEFTAEVDARRAARKEGSRPMNPNPLDFPALEGRPVTQGHTDRCRAMGHATHTVSGRDTGVCPRCGDVTDPGPYALPRVSLVKRTHALPPVGSHVEFISAEDDSRTWYEGWVYRHSFSGNGNVWITDVPEVETCRNVYLALPTEVRPYR